MYLYQGIIDDKPVPVTVLQWGKTDVEIIRNSRINGRDIKKVAGFWAAKSELIPLTVEANNKLK